MQVRLTAGARRDLELIYRRRRALRGTDGEAGADALLAELVGAIESLARFAERGQVPDELDVLGIRTYRQLSKPPFRIIYRSDGEMVTVMVVADARRDFRSLLEDRLLRAGH